MSHYFRSYDFLPVYFPCVRISEGVAIFAGHSLGHVYEFDWDDANEKKISCVNDIGYKKSNNDIRSRKPDVIHPRAFR